MAEQVKKQRNGTTYADAGRKGGGAQVKKGFAKMAKKKLREIARRAAAARWALARDRARQSILSGGRQAHAK